MNQEDKIQTVCPHCPNLIDEDEVVCPHCGEAVVEEDPKYTNAQFKTHSRGKVKNKYRNMACPCGSGKKFKKCCIGKVD